MVGGQRRGRFGKFSHSGRVTGKLSTCITDDLLPENEKMKSCLRRDSNLHTRQTLYQLSQRGSSVGQAESLSVIQGQRRLFPDKQGGSYTYANTRRHNRHHKHTG